MVKAAALLIMFALATLGLGILAYMLAPPGASAVTALAVTGPVALLGLTCAVLCVIGAGPAADGKPNRLGMIGVHGGLALPLLLLLGVTLRAVPLTSSIIDAHARRGQEQPAAVALAETVINDAIGNEQAAIDAKAIGRDYLAMTLWGLAGVSLTTLAGLLLLRPRPKAAA